MRITLDARLLAGGVTSGIPGYTRELFHTLITSYPEHTFAIFYTGLRRAPLPESWHQYQNVHVISKRIPNRILDCTMRITNRPRPDHYWPTDLIFSPHFTVLPHTTTPRIVTFHDLSFLRYPQFFSPQQKLWHALQRYTEQARAATHLIAVSEFTKNDLHELLGVPLEKITVVPSGVDRSFQKIDRADLRLTNYKTHHAFTRPFILSLGSLEPRKNIPLLIRAFTELKHTGRFWDYELIIAGKPGYRAEEIFRLAARSSAAADIRFLTEVKDDERILLYNLAQVFVYPSFFEGFGFPPLEAQACGTPVISSNRSSLPEILAGSALSIDPWDVSALAAHIEIIETNTKVRENSIVAGLANARRFSWQATALQTMKIFDVHHPPHHE